VYSPIAQGVLAGKYKPGEQPPAGTRAATPGDSGFMERFMRDDLLGAVQKLRPIADELGITMAQLAIAWVLREPGVSSAIVGASRPEQVDENVAASGIELSPEILRRIDEILEPVL
jgi:aryl-alcohol dehydrogenase-like predicted oxidoreductase